MGITYEEMVTRQERDSYGRLVRETRERKTRTLTAPSDWGMFTKAGDRSLTKKAETVLKKAERAMDITSAYERGLAINAALISFLAGWERMAYTKNYPEASDTAVRESVGYFHDTVLKATVGLDHDAWERNRAEAYRRVAKQRRAS